MSKQSDSRARSYVSKGNHPRAVEYKVSAVEPKVKGLILDYCGILDGSRDSQEQWHDLLRSLIAHGVGVSVIYHDLMGTPEWFTPLANLRDDKCAHSIVKVGCDARGSSMSSKQVDDAAASLNLDSSECVVLTTDVDSMMTALDAGAVTHLVQENKMARFFTESSFEHMLTAHGVTDMSTANDTREAA